MSPQRGAAWEWLACFAVLAALLVWGEPYWLTNDDVAMAMVAHGYGIADSSSPALVFSNVLYGILIDHVPPLAGLQGYTIASYALLLLSCAATCWALARASLPPALGAATVIALYAPIVLAPQFTLLAGALAIAGLLLLGAPRSRFDLGRLGVAVAFLVAAALVRLQELLLVAGVALPLLLPGLRRSGQGAFALRGAMIAGAILVVACFAYERIYYSSTDWRYFVALAAPPIRFTDYGLSRYFLANPLDAMRLGFTPNDLALFESFFFSDERVFPAARLIALAETVSWTGWALNNLALHRQLVTPFLDAHFVALAITLAIVGAPRPKVLAWPLLVLALAMIATLIVGRPGVTTIFVPALGAILLLRLAMPTAAPPSRGAAALVLAVATLLCATAVHLNFAERNEAREARAEACRLPSDRLFIIWGDQFPFQRVYRPFGPPGGDCPLRMYGLGSLASMPFALRQLHTVTSGQDVVGALLAGHALDFLARSWQVDLLQRHMRIHYRARLVTSRMSDARHYTWYKVRVEAPERN